MRISTHTLRKEGDPDFLIHTVILLSISTHTLRKEGDELTVDFFRIKQLISTHTLRKEGDVGTGLSFLKKSLFQPTPSARRVTANPYNSINRSAP